ncbi:MAG: ribosome-associated protein [Phormidesmis priestleyi Ana]|uniref:Ribosome-associated protein n=1 Tax=Phormidesmis priestleyi Ana TaxID=1666911 RepID=A0A0N8KN99_9CYAN|nr:MAG: ribosome-associated protein [Phormidesmis priestleyi Ana]
MSADFIKLDQFLKVTNTVQSGGEAKLLIRSGEVTVNGVMELRRGRKLYDRDVVALEGVSFTVEMAAGNEPESEPT